MHAVTSVSAESVPAETTAVKPAAAGRSLPRRRLCVRTRLDRELTRPMVWLTLAFVALMCLALPHSFVALPEELGGSAGSGAGTGGGGGAAERLTLLNNLAVLGLVLLAIPFWVEAIARLLFIEHGETPGCLVPRPSRGRALYLVACAIIPPLRAGLHPATLPGRTWLPGFGWRRVTRMLSRDVQRAFGVPMLCIGLLILPVLLGELIYAKRMHEHPGIAAGLDVATRLIWFAFALEFIVMMAVTPRKLEYAIRHWVDLVIILLPFVAFLRSLQVLRAGQLLKAQRMSQLARTYRLRGVAVKLLQAFLLLRVLEGVSERAAKRRIVNLREQIKRRETEIEDMTADLRILRKELAERKRKKRGGR